MEPRAEAPLAPFCFSAPRAVAMNPVNRERKLTIRLRQRELETITRAAQASGERIATFVRSVVVEGARRRLARHRAERKG